MADQKKVMEAINGLLEDDDDMPAAPAEGLEVEPAADDMVVVNVSGGVVTDVYTSKPMKVCKVDWDAIKEGDEPSCYDSTPMDKMPEDVKAKVDAASAPAAE